MKIDIKKLNVHLIRKSMTLACFRMEGVSAEALRRIRLGANVKPSTVNIIANVLGIEPGEILADENGKSAAQKTFY